MVASCQCKLQVSCALQIGGRSIQRRRKRGLQQETEFLAETRSLLVQKGCWLVTHDWHINFQGI